MCIFCGGQCGGMGEFFISLGLPFLALYLSRIKNALRRIKNKIARRGELPDETIKCSCCGELLQDCREISPQAIEPKNLELIEIKSQHKGPIENLIGITSLSKPIKLKKKGEPRGVRGWLLLLCLILTIFLPTSYLYHVFSMLGLINSPVNHIMFLTYKRLLIYYVLIFATMGFMAAFSFYAGLQLWEVKPAAVKVTKIFLIIQLLLTVLIAVMRSFMSSLIVSEDIFGVMIQIMIPSLFHFSLWYLYLSMSRRVHNTYGEIDKKGLIIGQLPAELRSSTEII